MTTHRINSHADLADTTEVELSVVFPAYNEAAVIGGLVERAARHLDSRGISYEINVVDDGSRDGTGDILSTLTARRPALRVTRHPVNLGYGAAIRSGIAVAAGRHVLVSDGDGQFRIEDLDRLWSRRDAADMVLGYRNPRNDPWLRRVAGWAYNRVLVRWLLGGDFRDVNCGFKLLRRDLVEEIDLRSNGALISAELLTRARLAGATFQEVGVSHLPRHRGNATGLLPRVVVGMLRELVKLRGSILRQARRGSGNGLRPGCDAVESASASAG